LASPSFQDSSLSVG